MTDGELYALVCCDDHAAIYREGKKILSGDSGEMTHRLLEILQVTRITLNDDAIEGDFPDTLSEVDE